ncbi:MAG: CocE/NonD family hydrolase [Actinobacteria bacterium]|nr:CocE/NonD family hydrolase [Actinomycetota bacterium]
MSVQLRPSLLRAVLAALLTVGSLATSAVTATAAPTGSLAGDGQAPAGVGPHTWTVEDVRITSSNGPDGAETVELDAAIWTPDDASAANPMPAMLIAPGFGNTKTAPEMVTLAAYFASHGYVAMTFTPQGFGESTGCIGLDSRTYDGRNAITMIDHLASLDHVAEDAPGDPQVGMVGGSYGGGLQGHTAVADPRIDAIAPGRTWVDLQYSLDPNNWVRDADAPYDVTGHEQGVFKQGWTSLFFAAGTAQPAQGNGGCDPVTRATMYPTATPCTSWIPGICETYVRVSTTGDVNEDDRELIADSSTGPELSQVDVPTLLPQGLPDTLFNVNETVPWLVDLQRRDVPVAVIWHSSGHGGYDPAPGDGEPYGGTFDDSPERQAEFARSYIPRRILAWMERHVRGDASVDTGPAFAYFRDWVDYDVEQTGGTAAPAYGTSAAVPAADTGFTLDPADGELVPEGGAVDGGEATFLNPPGGVPAAYSEVPNFSSPGAEGDRPAQDLPGQHLAFETAPLDQPMDVVGVPFLDLHLSHDNPLRDARLFAKLYDVAPDGSATLVHRQVAPSRIPGDALAGGPTTLRLIGTSHRFDAGHRVRLVVAATDLAYDNERSPDALTVSSTGDAPSVLRLPVVGGAPAPTPLPPGPDDAPGGPAAPGALPATGGGAAVAGLAVLAAAALRRRPT